MASNFHEQFSRPEPPLPSDRSTGLVLAAAAVAGAYFWRAHGIVFYGALTLTLLLVLFAIFAPCRLRWLNVAWMKLALLISKVMHPVVMLLLFSIAIVPAGLIMQLCRDPLRRSRRSNDKSYWVERTPSTTSSMSNQF